MYYLHVHEFVLLFTTGSFKIRGVLNQFLTLPDDCGTKQRPLISMSAGNYGKAFAFLCNKMALTGHIVMPDTAPDNRAQLIQVLAVSQSSPYSGVAGWYSLFSSFFVVHLMQVF